MTLKERIATEMRATFLNTDEMAETIVYIYSGGVTKSITAVVDRDPYGVTFSNDGEGIIKQVAISFSSDATAGVATPTVNDSVTLDSVTWRIVEVTLDGGFGIHDVRAVLYVPISRERDTRTIRRL